jgi:hypothetical protein
MLGTDDFAKETRFSFAIAILSIQTIIGI